MVTYQKPCFSLQTVDHCQEYNSTRIAHQLHIHPRHHGRPAHEHIVDGRALVYSGRRRRR